MAAAFNWTTKFLFEMPVDTQVRVSEVKVNDKQILIECVKCFIDVYGGVEFNSDYTKIRKIRETNIPTK